MSRAPSECFTPDCLLSIVLASAPAHGHAQHSCCALLCCAAPAIRASPVAGSAAVVVVAASLAVVAEPAAVVVVVAARPVVVAVVGPADLRDRRRCPIARSFATSVELKCLRAGKA